MVLFAAHTLYVGHVWGYLLLKLTDELCDLGHHWEAANAEYGRNKVDHLFPLNNVILILGIWVPRLIPSMFIVQSVGIELVQVFHICLHSGF